MTEKEALRLASEYGVTESYKFARRQGYTIADVLDDLDL